VRTQQWLKRLGNVLMASIAVTDFEKESLNRDLLTAIVVVSDEIWKNLGHTWKKAVIKHFHA